MARRGGRIVERTVAKRTASTSSGLDVLHKTGFFTTCMGERLDRVDVWERRGEGMDGWGVLLFLLVVNVLLFYHLHVWCRCSAHLCSVFYCRRRFPISSFLSLAVVVSPCSCFCVSVVARVCSIPLPPFPPTLCCFGICKFSCRRLLKTNQPSGGIEER